ncbi:prenyltransferase [Candidatus Skiveiella danica]|uniref:prenyltransferase n=1 Tax=Candidatus Skiveiella danica TaxID=3386177 RepID=UPI0039B8ECE8
MAPLTPPPPGTPTPPRDGRLLLRMTRPAFLTVTAVACLLGLSTAAACTGGLKVPRALATLLLALVAHAGANVLNDYFDARNGADAANDQGLFPFTGGSRLIQTGAVSVADTGRWAAFLLLALIPLGLWLAVLCGSGLLAIGAAGLFLAWAYSAPPLALMSRGLGEAAVALAWWLVVLGADYTQRGHFSVITAATAVSLALLLANILLINGFPDAEPDARVGKRTLVVRLGPIPAAGFYLGLALLAHSWLATSVWLLITPRAAMWGLVSLPLSLAAAGLLWRHAAAPQRLRPAIALTIAAASLHGLAMAAGLATMAWG